ncbi:preprotein translocase subunit SecG [Nafulsella turpanensis]|uniref:preprotein translocase subunit SecG n=1 Tax=Nafulsella turpanensis TaxID=1265690 RepID=UPI00034743D0|nr:preprotein translocase subunit SecG [Nafulsella turpanensis]
MNLIVILIVIIALLLMLVILAQNSKGGGLSSQFGGSGTSQLMGVKRTGDLLEKITWGLAIAMLALTLSTSFFIDGTREGGIVSPNIQRAQEQQTVVPGLGGQELEEGALEGEPVEEEGALDTGVELDEPVEEEE